MAGPRKGSALGEIQGIRSLQEDRFEHGVLLVLAGVGIPMVVGASGSADGGRACNSTGRGRRLYSGRKKVPS